VKCDACKKELRNLGIGPKPLWHCDHCEMADTEPLTDPGLGETPPITWHIKLDPTVPPNQIRIISKWYTFK
jgi:hypothetical protein